MFTHYETASRSSIGAGPALFFLRMIRQYAEDLKTRQQTDRSFEQFLPGILQLESSDGTIRLSPREENELRSALGHKEAVVRYHAAYLLSLTSAASHKRMIRTLITMLLRDADVEVQWAAAAALSRCGAVALPPLLHAVRYLEPGEVKMRAIASLARLGYPAGRTMEAYHDGNYYDGCDDCYVTSVRKYGRDALRAFFQMLGSGQPLYQRFAVRCLSVLFNRGGCDPAPLWYYEVAAREDAVFLHRFLSDPDPYIRAMVAMVTVTMGMEVEEVLPALLEAWELSVQLPEIFIGWEHSAQDVPRIVPGIQVAVQCRLIWCFGRLGKATPVVVTLLQAAVRHPDAFVRRKAVAAIGQLRGGDFDLHEVLLDAFEDEDDKVREAARKALDDWFERALES